MQSNEPKQQRGVLRPEHEVKYGVSVTSRDVNTGDALQATCLFCVHFGRQIRSERARSIATQVKVYEPPFRTDNFVQHNRLHHWDHWIAYSGQDPDAKLVYFPAALIPSTMQIAVAPKRRSAAPAKRPASPEPEPTKKAKPDAISLVDLLELERTKYALETDMMKMDLELKNVQVVLSTMLARQKLVNAGVPRSDIDAMLPLPLPAQRQPTTIARI
ncbi:hypothetical protein SDRG_09985 [Saprolegnia diclina VS20]|uniref:Uncharacterized protein n=1 Tax=Saprolegnia diclina (strain VS20) TaxID=1156394 RepID=T0QF61_SAPDV|nr:hypothetical protein SDRG_09985 [Saprolegnia diclina VS20]EQC32235.1 hypothetical protein SDRG_09985 [Saprolegnia diclina VS20]|eukprot:XP_008614176.1 hypothetical protein SDRG_09985 [Saprolegnia diclina VS20]